MKRVLASIVAITMVLTMALCMTACEEKDPAFLGSSQQDTDTTTTTTSPASEEICEVCGAKVQQGEGVTTPLGLYICKSCDDRGAGGTTPVKDPEIPQENSFLTIENGVLVKCDENAKGTVTIPEGVTKIGEMAFHFCTEIDTVVIPDSVTMIDSYAFSACFKLVDINIPDSVSTIGEGAFSTCTSLKEITLPDTVTSLGNGAFSGCEKLESVNIPSEVSIIRANTFNGCKSLANIEIPSTVTSIGEAAFAECDGLTAITIPEKVTVIGERAFENCNNLTTVSLPDGVTMIGENAFSRSPKVVLSYKGKTYTDEEIKGLYGTHESSNLTIQDGVLVSCHESATGTVVIPEDVTEIGEDAFRFCSNVKEIHIPASVRSIRRGAFSDCEGLEKIVVDENSGYFTVVDGVLMTKDLTALRCYPASKSGTTYTVPDSVTVIGECAFSCAKNLEEIVLSKNCLSVADHAFDGCTSLKTLKFGEKVRTITDYTFIGCSLEQIIVDENNKNFTSEDGVLFDKEKTTLIKYPCDKEGTEYVIPDTVKTIRFLAFEYCGDLETIVIPDSVVRIEDFAFSYCDSLKYCDVPDSVTELGIYIFHECDNLAHVIV